MSVRHAVLLALLAIAFRLAIGYVIFPPGIGYGGDLDLFRLWAADLGANGPFGAYDRGYRLDYLPGYLLLLWPLGAISDLITGSPDPGSFVKLPAILADGLLVVASVRLAIELGAPPRSQWILALTLAFGPMIWIDSTIWGQVDSVGTCLLVLSATELIKGNLFRSSTLGALAAVVKPQFGILIPIIVLVATSTSLRSRSAKPLLFSGLVGIAAVAFAAWPFGLTILDVVSEVLKAAGQYPTLSANAWNIWALVSVDGSGIAVDGTWISDGLLLFGGGPSAALIGAFSFITLLLLVLWGVRKGTRLQTIAGLAVVAIAFFVLPTRVHERYLFPAIPLALIVASVKREWWVVVVPISISFLLNTSGVLTAHFLEDTNKYDLGSLGALFRSDFAIVAISILQSPISVVTAATLSIFGLAGASFLLLARDSKRVG